MTRHRLLNIVIAATELVAFLFVLMDLFVWRKL